MKKPSAAKKRPGPQSRKNRRTAPARSATAAPNAARNTIPAGNVLEPNELAGLPLLKNVGLEDVWDLIKGLPTRQLNKGDVLIEKGQPNSTMYLVVRGRLIVNLDPPQGKPVATIESGQAVGELSVIDHRPTSADIVAAMSTQVLLISEDIFWHLVAVSHQFAKNMFLLLTHRMRATNITIAETMRLHEILEHDATFDNLTGQRNRRWFDANLKRFIDRHQRSGRPLSLIMFDVDHFKKFNDTYGHAAGDRVLMAVGRAIDTRLRPSDFGVRYGGEEFCVICMETDLAGGFVAAERLRQKISLMPLESYGDTTLPGITISLGVGQLAKNETISRFIKRIDDALYRAKNRGRNCTEPAWDE
ncbi:MAG: GGDEF domain-containing protein [Chitinispirillaceae bacterium]|nr:GGDEF domain-containing protein [Chitinispirillaceae bacterium]